MRLSGAGIAIAVLVLASAPPLHGAGSSSVMRRIPGGAYRPLYGTTVPRRIPAFMMDDRAVTNGEFLEFVRAHPEWRRSQAQSLFVDEAYLRAWTSDLEPGPDAPREAPVVYVSWFAARAYLKAAGKQLPTVDQWEYAAGRRAATLTEVPLHEWTLDFNAALVGGDSRGDGSLDRNLFCGAAALGASDTGDYGAFLRSAYRASLSARYALSGLGFRGVKALP